MYFDIPSLLIIMKNYFFKNPVVEHLAFTTGQAIILISIVFISIFSAGFAKAVDSTPTITSISSTSVLAGTTITITGTGFTSTSSAIYSSPVISVGYLSTTFISSTQLTAVIPTSGVAGAYGITVINQGAFVGSNIVTIIVTTPAPTQAQTPTPIPVTTSPATNTSSTTNSNLMITSISPKAKNVGDQSFILNVVGSGFTPSSVIFFNDLKMLTTFHTSTGNPYIIEALSADIPASAITTAGMYNVKVVNPAPPKDGAVSNVSLFTVAPVPTQTSVQNQNPTQIQMPTPTATSPTRTTPTPTPTQTSTTTSTVISPYPTSTSTSTGNIKIITSLNGGNYGKFYFTIFNTSNGDSSSVNIITKGSSGSFTIPSLPVGTYSITESVQDGWQFNSASCAGTGVSVTNGITNIVISSNTTVSCVFYNKLISTQSTTTQQSSASSGAVSGQGTLIIEEQVFGRDSDGKPLLINTSFDFSISSVSGTKTIDIINSATTDTPPILLNPGKYSVSQILKDKFPLIGIGCSDTTQKSGSQEYISLSFPPYGKDKFTNTANGVDIKANVITTCGFINDTKPSSEPPSEDPGTSATTGDVMVKRVGSDLSTESAPSTRVLLGAYDETVNPALFKDLKPGLFDLLVTDVPEYRETAGICTYPVEGKECIVSKFSVPVVCGASHKTLKVCYVNSDEALIVAGQVTKVVFKYAKPSLEEPPKEEPPSSTGGSIRIERVNDNLQRIGSRSGGIPETSAWVNSLDAQTANPAIFNNLVYSLPPKIDTISVTDLPGYEETAGSCIYPIRGTECTVSKFYDLKNGSCNGSSCSFPVDVITGKVFKFVFKYTEITAPKCDVDDNGVSLCGEIQIVKIAEGDEGDFDFTSNILPYYPKFRIMTINNTVNSNSMMNKYLINIPPGSYTVSEVASSGWKLREAVCDGEVVTNSAGETIANSIKVIAGETTVCVFRNMPAPSASSAGASSSNPSPSITYGQSGDAVNNLQQVLMQLGYSISSGVTGYFGNQTRMALANFQTDNGLSSQNAALGKSVGPWTKAMFLKYGFNVESITQSPSGSSSGSSNNQSGTDRPASSNLCGGYPWEDRGLHKELWVNKKLCRMNCEDITRKVGITKWVEAKPADCRSLYGY